ncbi:MAG: hypothetical protein QXF55_02425 [Candidatus Aenigmatarchaeota archaeon]
MQVVGRYESIEELCKDRGITKRNGLGSYLKRNNLELCQQGGKLVLYRMGSNQASEESATTLNALDDASRILEDR